MPPGLRPLLALVAGLAAGVALDAAPAALRVGVLAAAEPIATLWVAAIRMIVVPLVVTLLVTGVAAADPARLGQLGGRAVVVAAAVLAGVAALAALAAPPFLDRLPIDASTIAALRAGAASAPAAGSVAAPGFRDWLVGLVPTNPVRAAADGALLPLVVFTLLLAIAATRLPAETRAPLVAVCRGIAEALLVVVRWVLALAPVGVLALALPLGARLGVAAAGAVAGYVALIAVLCVAAIVALLLAAVAAGVPGRALVRASAPAQLIAAGSRSSLAALPAMLRGAERHLDAPPGATEVLLPVLVTTFRPSVPIAIVAGTLFLARLHGVVLSPTDLAGVAASAALLSLSVPGVPGAAFLVMTPVLAGLGIPPEGIGLLLAVDVVPDAIRTLTNVSGQMAVTAIVARRPGAAARGEPDVAAGRAGR